MEIEDAVRSSSVGLLSRMVSHKRYIAYVRHATSVRHQGLFEGLTQTALHTMDVRCLGMEYQPALPSYSPCLTV